METLVLARHGESDLSARGIANGDPARACVLTDAGRVQARRLAELIARDRFDLYVTSAFTRTQETADLALAGRDVPRLVVPELNDIRFGDFESGAFDDYRAWARSASPTDVPPGDGESRATCVARYVLNALESRPPQPILDQVPYAEPFRLSADELAGAVDRLEAWAASPAWT